ncbi:MAG: DNA-binding domain-containing protein [Candidatus Magnetoglobus multicellularis str. Araruama]|uniref:DNA-binding domain-containing protein n=1 Tax=Candidatus Magnetoglobus multicellularis str. Araruama TaxID=890399 RepID=A0A1V1NZD9_9BACT|nr:MAG: DNA-binding domain-containing protein [Candidatus Magnetoglobus multicellularis str. Araruama]
MANIIIPIEQISSKIYSIRNAKVMLDRDLAKFYNVETRVLKQAVRRNMKRFPSDFMFELSKEEFSNWRSQFVTSNSDKMGLRYAPMAFTELGVAMLSSVLKSDNAIEINIQIMRVFTQLKQMAINNKEFHKELQELKNQTDERFKIVFETLDHILSVENKPKRQIGF